MQIGRVLQYFSMKQWSVSQQAVNSEQLPCRSAEVKNFSVFLCQRCREIWREVLVKFSALRFPGFGCATENFTKASRQKRCEKRKISRKFHSAGSLNGCLGATERGAWRGVGREGWQRVGERLAQGWHKIGEGLADFLAPSYFGIPGAPV